MDEEDHTTGPRSVISSAPSNLSLGPLNPRLLMILAAPSEWLAAKPLLGFVSTLKMVSSETRQAESVRSDLNDHQ